MLEFQPKKDITAWELVQVTRLTGGIVPGTPARAMELQKDGAPLRHFVCWERRLYAEDASDCEECEFCAFKGRGFFGYD